MIETGSTPLDTFAICGHGLALRGLQSVSDLELDQLGLLCARTTCMPLP